MLLDSTNSRSYRARYASQVQARCGVATRRRRRSTPKRWPKVRLNSRAVTLPVTREIWRGVSGDPRIDPIPGEVHFSWIIQPLGVAIWRDFKFPAWRSSRPTTCQVFQWMLTFPWRAELFSNVFSSFKLRMERQRPPYSQDRCIQKIAQVRSEMFVHESLVEMAAVETIDPRYFFFVPANTVHLGALPFSFAWTCSVFSPTLLYTKLTSTYLTRRFRRLLCFLPSVFA